MVTVRGRNRKSIAPRMAPPRDVPVRTESEDEEELLEGDSTATNDATEVTFIQAPCEADSDSVEKRFLKAACNDGGGVDVKEAVAVTKKVPDGTSIVADSTTPAAEVASTKNQSPRVDSQPQNQISKFCHQHQILSLT